jgi:mannose/cellobiose epimerase-like protein (N-acyl-D-glucosamine 2-epimerase family)
VTASSLAHLEAALLARWRGWFEQEALPFWLARGFRADGLAVEQLDLDGTPDPSPPLRVRSQARQVYVFAQATRLGLLEAGAAQAASTLRALERAAHGPDGRPGWVHVLTPEGGVADGRRDLYDHAFVLLMLAEARASLGDGPWIGWLEQALIELDTLFPAGHGGYGETDTGGLPRRQNPHMHLFEALLAAFEATGEACFLARAGEIFGLFRTRFFDEPEGVLREFFAADWALLPDGASDAIEPGHLMEWVWLLRRYERLSHRPVAPLAARLFERGEALGRLPAAGGCLADVVDLGGRPLADSRRLWPQTEYLKALVVEGRATGDAALLARATALSDRIFDEYLAGVPAGAWQDRFELSGRPVVTTVPASTFYHLLGVLAELLVVAGAADGDRR